MSPEAMGDFVIKLAQHYGIDRMHAVGPDVGTLALLFAAVRSPQRFAALGAKLPCLREKIPCFAFREFPRKSVGFCGARHCARHRQACESSDPFWTPCDYSDDTSARGCN